MAASGVDDVEVAWVRSERVAEERGRASRALTGRNGVSVAVVPCASNAVASPQAAGEDSGNHALLSCAENAGPEHADDGLEKNAALIVGASELLREAVQRGAVKEVTHCIGRDVKGVVGIGCSVGELERSRPGPAEAVKLEVGDRDGACGGVPRGGARVRAGKVVGAGEVREAERFGTKRGGAPNFVSSAGGGRVASATSGVPLQKTDSRERSAAGFGAEGGRRVPWGCGERRR